MKSRQATIILLIAGWISNVSAGEFGFTLSASDVDPFVNRAQPTSEPQWFYIWLACSNICFSSAAGFSLIEDGITVLAVEATNGFYIIWNPPYVYPAVGCCLGPGGPFLAGRVLVMNNPGSLCFGPDKNGDPPWAVGPSYPPPSPCPGDPLDYPIDWIGITTTGDPIPCSNNLVPCQDPVSVEMESWGRLKSTYR